MLTYLFLLFISLFELHQWIKGGSGKDSSRTFAILIALFCISTLIYSVIYVIKSKKNETEKEARKNKCRACFSGLKDSKLKRTHIIFFFSRRILLSSIVFLLADSSITAKLI